MPVFCPMEGFVRNASPGGTHIRVVCPGEADRVAAGTGSRSGPLGLCFDATEPALTEGGRVGIVPALIGELR